MGRFKANCDRCSFTQEMSELPRSYRVADGVKLYIQTQWAWCASCRLITSSEKIRPLEEIQWELKCLLAREPDILDWVQKSILPKEDFEASYQRQVARLTTRLDWRQSRQSPPRCLECGATSITPFEWHENDDLNLEEYETIVHPNCGGCLHLKCVGLNRPKVEYCYSSEGLRIDA